MLHTPLMSGTNFIHGIVLVGALTVAGSAHDTLGYIIAIAAVLLGTLNVVGGWVVTDRMLQMFRRRPAADAHKAETPPKLRITDTGAAATALRAHDPRLHGDRRRLHVRHPAAAVAGHGADGQSHCCSWHVARARHHRRAHSQHGQLAA